MGIVGLINVFPVIPRFALVARATPRKDDGDSQNQDQK
jgi:hypothetical protein